MEDYKAETIKSYNKHAEFFSEKFKGLFNLEKRTEFKRMMELVNGEKILDIGCGDGEHAAYFKENGLDVTCIDISDKFVEMCKSRGLNAQIMDVEDLKFDDNSFDGVWAITSLLHVPKVKIEGVLDRIDRLLKSGGIFYICVKEGEGERFIVDSNDSSTKRFFSFWREKELLKVFERRFELIEFERKEKGDTVFLGFFFRKK